MIQQLMVDEATALSMFPKFPIFVAGDGENAIRYEPPLTTWLAGPIWCQTCEGRQVGDPVDEYECEPCDGRGYPSILGIVSTFNHAPSRESKSTTSPRQRHGGIDLGAPIKVVSEHDYEPNVEAVEVTDQGMVFHHHAVDDAMKMTDITNAIAGTPTPGGVVYPVTVRS